MKEVKSYKNQLKCYVLLYLLSLILILISTLFFPTLTTAITFKYKHPHQNCSHQHQLTPSTTISLTLEETRELEPDVFRLHINITAKKERESDVLNLLGAVDKEIRKLNLDYQGGRYYINKNCFWKNDKWKCVGFIGHVNYVFNLKEPKDQNKIFEALEIFKDKHIEYKVYGSGWIISERKYKEVERSLKLDILSQALDYGKKMSEILGKKCELEKISYKYRSYYPELPIRAFIREDVLESKKLKNVEAPEPKKDDKAISLRAGVVYQCLDEFSIPKASQ